MRHLPIVILFIAIFCGLGASADDSFLRDRFKQNLWIYKNEVLWPASLLFSGPTFTKETSPTGVCLNVGRLHYAAFQVHDRLGFLQVDAVYSHLLDSEGEMAFRVLVTEASELISILDPFTTECYNGTPLSPEKMTALQDSLEKKFTSLRTHFEKVRLSLKKGAAN